ncbi:hypothetical protein [Alistipes timonensis]
MKTICIGQIPQDHTRYLFDQAITKLRELVTADKVGEYGEELTTAFIRELLQGGHAIRSRLLDKFNVSLSAILFPAERRQKEALYGTLLSQFDELTRNACKTIEDFKYIPIEAYTVGSEGIGYDPEMIDKAFAEAGNVCISHPSQVEVYNAAQKAIAAIHELDALAQKYGMYAVNKNNYRSIINIDLEMDTTIGVLGAKRVIQLNLFAVQQAYDGGLFNNPKG